MKWSCLRFNPNSYANALPRGQKLVGRFDHFELYHFGFIFKLKSLGFATVIHPIEIQVQVRDGVAPRNGRFVI